MSFFAKSLVLALLPMAIGTPFWNPRSPTDLANKRDNNFIWGSVGDSWAAGVSYSPVKHTDYDGDLHHCHRWKDSYGPIMERNTSWTTGLQEFKFAACSGAILVNIVKDQQGEDDPNPPQMDQVGNPQMITYHAGGNNCGFGTVMSECIYQPDCLNPFNCDYGLEYPDPSGRCAQQIALRNSYINDAGKEGLYQQEKNTVVDLLGHPAVKDNKDFRLYVLGYAHFFNLGDNYCNDITFSAAPWRSKPKLSNQLRTALNDAVERVNQILIRVVADVGDPRAKFLDISHAFDHHRFCENHHNYKDQWYNSDVWLWNLNTPADDPPADPALISAWLSSGELPDNTTVGALPDNATIGVEIQGGVETEGSGGSTGNLPTWLQRPFHPKQGGTQAIADIIITQALADKIPGVVGSSPPVTGTCDCNESGCSVESPACCANNSC